MRIRFLVDVAVIDEGRVLRGGVTLGELGADPLYGPDTISFGRFRFPCM